MHIARGAPFPTRYNTYLTFLQTLGKMPYSHEYKRNQLPTWENQELYTMRLRQNHLNHNNKTRWRAEYSQYSRYSPGNDLTSAPTFPHRPIHLLHLSRHSLVTSSGLFGRNPQAQMKSKEKRIAALYCPHASSSKETKSPQILADQLSFVSERTEGGDLIPSCS